MKKNILLILLLVFFHGPIIGQTLKKEKQFSQHQALPFYGFKKKNNTSVFQGNKKKKNYFEGWYFKMVSANEQAIISVIPGISLSENGDQQHAFIQVIDGITAKTYYFNFPIEDFYFSKKEFAVRIGENYFSKDSLVLNVNDGKVKIKGTILISDPTPYKIGNRQPAIMGWYRFVPFMQCYHGVVSLTHSLSGNLLLNSEKFDFESGKGYIEKDWGESMPEAWIWMQTNTFVDRSTSFMLSVANIPWLGKSFTGFLGFLHYKGETYRFATYTNDKLTIKKISEKKLLIRIKNRKRTIVIETESKQSGLLKAPIKGSMDRRISESVDSNIKISLINKKGKTIYTDSTTTAGLEIVGEIDNLLGTFK